MSNIQIVIEPGRLERQYWRDLWRYRELFWLLAWRNVSVQYKQTVIGVAWAVVRPLATLVVFVVVFGKVARLPSDGVPYPLLVFAGMLPWQLFATILGDSSNSLVNNAHLISKIYFPRLIVPATAVGVSLVDVLVSVPVFAGLIVYYGQPLAWSMLAVPVLLLLVVALALGTGLWLSALNVRYRDVRVVLPFVIQFGLYLSPVGFTSSVVPPEYRWLYGLNPIVGIIDGVRWALFGSQGFPGFELLCSITITAVVVASGISYFRRTERTFADII